MAGGPAPARERWTVGHSNHPHERLVELLRLAGIETVIDVRSVPRSAQFPQHDGPVLSRGLRRAGINYVFMGDQLGGRPPEDAYYDDAGHVRYDLLAASPRFRAGIERLLRLGAGRRVAVLCSEESPEHCHRRLLVGRVLTERGIVLRHIRGDGSVQTETSVEIPQAAQPSLFDHEARPMWRSTRSVSPNARPRTSSRPSAEQASGG